MANGPEQEGFPDIEDPVVQALRLMDAGKAQGTAGFAALRALLNDPEVMEAAKAVQEAKRRTTGSTPRFHEALFTAARQVAGKRVSERASQGHNRAMRQGQRGAAQDATGLLPSAAPQQPGGGGLLEMLLGRQITPPGQNGR